MIVCKFTSAGSRLNKQTFNPNRNMNKFVPYTKLIKTSEIVTKMALVIRTDLKLGKGKIAAQCSHAAILCYERSLQQNPELLTSWLRNGQSKIVLKVDGLKEMENLFQKAKELGIVAELVRDAGKTQVEPSTITALGLGSHREKLDELIKSLHLL